MYKSLDDLVSLLYINFQFFFQPIEENLNMQEKVIGILTKLNMDNFRARSMDLDDFMRLLLAFNSEGIHFN